MIFPLLLNVISQFNDKFKMKSFVYIKRVMCNRSSVRVSFFFLDVLTSYMDVYYFQALGYRTKKKIDKSENLFIFLYSMQCSVVAICLSNYNYILVYILLLNDDVCVCIDHLCLDSNFRKNQSSGINCCVSVSLSDLTLNIYGDNDLFAFFAESC